MNASCPALENLIEKYGRGTLLCKLPVGEFDHGRVLQHALHQHGYTERASKVVSDLGLWNKTLGEFAETLTSKTTNPQRTHCMRTSLSDTTAQLEKLSNPELSEAVALEVAGWVRGNHKAGDMPWYEGRVTRKGGHMVHPDYATKFDKVQGLLEKMPDVRIWRNGLHDPWHVEVTAIIRGKHKAFEAFDRDLIRAACISLLLAVRDEKAQK